MAVTYTRFDGKRCSVEWKVVLDAAVRAGVLEPSSVNSLNRTMGEQNALFNKNMHLVGGHWVQKPGRPLTAWPSPSAPHIKVGRKDHAADINAPQVNPFVAWLRSKGLHVYFTVDKEPWHIEFLNEAELVRAAKMLKDPLAGFREDEARWIREYVRLKAANKDRDRRRVLRRVMLQRRQAIWHAHQPLIGLNLKRWRTLRRYTI